MKKTVTFAVLPMVVLLVATLAAGCGGTAKDERPHINTVSPDSGPEGTQVVVSGLNFGPVQALSNIYFGQTIASVVAWSNGEITVKVPSEPAAVSYPVTVITGAGSSNQAKFNVTAPPNPRPQPAPTPAPTPRPGESELDQAKDAANAWLDRGGYNHNHWKIYAAKQSATDPDWAAVWADNVPNDTPPEIDFLMAKRNGQWIIIAADTSWTPSQYGAPADLDRTKPPSNTG